MFDLVLRGGTVLDGTGRAGFSADIAVKDGRIAAIGNLSRAKSHESVDVDGLVIAPGFIDTHSHDDRYVLSDPDVPAKISQGITTVVTGNCGISLAPALAGKRALAPLDILGDSQDFRFERFVHYIEALDATPAAVNVYPLVGLTTLRVREVATLDAPAQSTEITNMRRLCEEALSAGALGVSIGTFYPPASAATADEIVAVLEPLRQFGGMLATHLRDETDYVIDSIDEALEIAKKLSARLIISHHKVAGVSNHGRSPETLAHIARAAIKQPVAMDVYPYAASSTTLRYERVVISTATYVTSSGALPQYDGWNLIDIACALECSIKEAVDRLQPARATYRLMSESDVDAIVSSSQSMIATDGLPHDRCPHPRLWGAFPRVLAAYVREKAALTLPAAIHKMTGLSARQFGLKDRGEIAIEKWADLCVFDSATVADRATVEHPTQAATGIEHVLVNGVFALKKGKQTGRHGGRRVLPSECAFRSPPRAKR